MKWLILSILVINVNCELKPCTPNTPSGPSPKVLADIFTAKVELKKQSNNEAIFIEEHYNSKLKLLSLEIKSPDSFSRTIVDYNTKQTTNIIFNGGKEITCTTTDNKLEEFFPGVHVFGGDLQVFAIAELFNFTNNFHDFLHIFQGNFTFENGIQADRWDFCASETDKTHFKYAHVYYSVVGWSVPALITRTPIRVEISSVEDGKETKWYYDIASYQPNIADQVKFQVPEGIFCPGRKSTKAFPEKFQSNNFYLRTESIVKPHKQFQWTDEWYFMDEQLARIDFVNPESAEPEFNGRSEIIDYKNRKVYVILPSSSAPCDFQDLKDVSSIAEGDTISLTTLLHLRMGSFYGPNLTYNYIGQRETRNLLADVWQAKRTDWPTASPQVTTVWEWYFTADSLTTIEDTEAEKYISAKLVVTIKEVQGTTPEESILKNGTKIVHNVYDVNFISDDEQLDLSVFDIGSCYSPAAKAHLEFSVDVKDPKGSILFHQMYSILFSNLWRKTLAQAADISLLRISELEVIPITDEVLIRFHLLDNNPAVTDGTALNVKKAAILQKLNSNQLKIDWTNQDGKKIQLFGKPNSLKNVVCIKPDPHFPATVKPSTRPLPKQEKGYSSSEMAANGIGCWLGGFLLSVGITFGLRRKIHFV